MAPAVELPSILPLPHGKLHQRVAAAMDHPELNLATRHPDDPERLVVVRLGRISEEHAAQAAWDFTQTWQIFPAYLEKPAGTDQGIIRTYPVVYHSLDTLLFASIDAPSIEIAHDWLEMITANCVMFNP
jgi:hypothetical protein